MRESDTAHLKLADAGATRELGAALARALSSFPSECFVIYLEGELGAGKTTLVAGLLATLGFKGPVRSPTYTLVEPYELQAGRALNHIDLYRLAAPDEVEPLGLRDLLRQTGILLIEWPSKGAGQLPSPDLTIKLEYEADGLQRRATVRGVTSKGCNLLAGLVAVTEQ
ncbi:MAG TPA: tRNA (adenosine(37)-N6)-threonylcarbamoyltransferase complex ATPase subunit type 1 TsaE [Steroidobacteraceae bacterium]|nr:tRNA (adenosine(37)-N6)-threonylcarbamoyltransferase complex ATPase subunit type 1 TsaE [Steroidobacteraceae bacterium]